MVGFLSMRSPGESASVEAAFRKGLSEAGYVEAQNVLAAFSECALVRRLRFRHRLPQRQVSFRPAISAVGYETTLAYPMPMIRFAASRLALDVTGQQMDETFLRSERFSELLARG